MKNDDQKQKVVMMDPSKIKLGDPKHHTFTKEILHDIEQIKTIFEEVRPISTKEWLDGFSRDEHPEKEIALWLYMGKIYSRVIQDYPADIAHRKAIFAVVLMCSMGEDGYVVRNAKSDVLSDDDVKKIIAEYRGKTV